MFCNSGAPCGSQTTAMLTAFCRGNSAFSFHIPERVALQIFPCQRLPVHTCAWLLCSRHVLEFSFAAVSFLYEAFALGELLLCFQFPFSPVPLPQLSVGSVRVGSVSLGRCLLLSLGQSLLCSMGLLAHCLGIDLKDDGWAFCAFAWRPPW